VGGFRYPQCSIRVVRFVLAALGLIGLFVWRRRMR
jgi:hypothetical protein